MGEARQAFILGAGLGTRLRPLTERLPKPLVPVANKPLVTYAFDHLIGELGVERFLVNTHHCPEAYGKEFPEHSYRDRSLEFRHEPVLLDTAGGIDNIRDWLPGGESFAVYNGDILTDLPLRRAWEHHLASGNLATLVLRSTGDELRVGFDPGTGSIVDLRGVLRPDWPHRFQFTGIYFLAPEFLEFVRPGVIESVVLPLLAAIESGRAIGGYVEDAGSWSDLGERESYIDAQALAGEAFRLSGGQRIAASAQIAESAEIDEFSSIGERARVGEGARVVESVLWDDAIVEPGAELRRVVVREGGCVEGRLEGVDV